jgi:hypothetical protein
MYNQQAPQDKDPVLWEVARKRASFKYHLGTYVVMNGFFWLLWAFTGRHDTHSGFPWPVWPMLGWGIGLMFHYLGAYVYPKHNSVEKEYEQLTREKNTFSNK